MFDLSLQCEICEATFYSDADRLHSSDIPLQRERTKLTGNSSFCTKVSSWIANRRKKCYF